MGNRNTSEAATDMPEDSLPIAETVLVTGRPSTEDRHSPKSEEPCSTKFTKPRKKKKKYGGDLPD